MSPRRLPLLASAVLVLAACSSGPGAPSSRDSARIVAADAEPGSWLTHGRTYSEQRYSPLTTNQRHERRTAWPGLVLRAEDRPRAAGDAARRRRRDVRDLGVEPRLCPRRRHRRRAVGLRPEGRSRGWREGLLRRRESRCRRSRTARCSSGAIDGRLFALDAASGRMLWETVTVDQSKPYTITGAPRAANGLVYIGNGGAEYRRARCMSRPTKRNTGTLAWRFYTVPGDPAERPGPGGVGSDHGEGMRPRGTDSGGRIGGGGTVWDAIVYDPEFKQLIVGVGNGSPWNQQHRSPGGGDNLFLASIVALDAAHRRVQVALPDHAWRDLGLHGDAAHHAGRPADRRQGRARSRCRRRRTASSTSWIVENGRLISAQALRADVAGAGHAAGMPISWAYAVDTATGRPGREPARPPLPRQAALGLRPSRRAQLAPDVVQPADRAWSTCRPRTMAFGYAHDPALDVREGFDNIGVVIDLLPDDEAVRAAIRSASKGMLLAWDPCRRSAQVWRSDRRGPCERRHARHRRRPRLPGDGRRAIPRARREDRQDAVVGRQPGRDAGWSDQLLRLRGAQYVAVTAGYGGSFFLIDSFLGPCCRAIRSTAACTSSSSAARPPKPVLALPDDAPMPKPPRLVGQRRRMPMRAARGSTSATAPCATASAALSGGVLPDLRRSVLPPGCRRLPPRGRRRRVGAAWHAALRGSTCRRPMRS